MWYWGVGTSLASKIMTEGVDLSEENRAKLSEALNKLDAGVSLLSGFDPKNPASWAIVASKILKNLANPSDVYTYSEDYLFARNATTVEGLFTFTRKTYQDLKRICPNKTVFKSEHSTTYVVEFHHKSMKNPFFFDITDNDYQLWTIEEGDAEKISALISEIFWGNNTCICMERSYSGGYWQTFNSPFDLEPYMYWGHLEEVADRWPKYRGKGIRRTSVIHGRPGMGKTTFSYWLANKISKKTIILMPQYFSHLSIHEWENLCNIADPEMIVFQDIHELNTDTLSQYLEIFEEKPNVVSNLSYIVCTANDFDHSSIPEALLRPGRLGDEVYLLDGDPPKQLMDKVIDNFLDTMGYADEFNEDHREFLYDAYREGSAALCKEVIKRMIVEGPEILEKEFSTIADLKELHESSAESAPFKISKHPRGMVKEESP